MDAPLANAAGESQYVTARSGIPKERIVNYDKIEIIKELEKVVEVLIK